MTKVILFGGVFLEPVEHETIGEPNSVFVPYASERGLIGIEYKRRTGTNLFYSDYQLSESDRKALEFQDWLSNAS